MAMRWLSRIRRSKRRGGGSPRIVIINFTGIRENWGCRATSWNLVQYLFRIFCTESIPKFDFVALLDRTEVDVQLETRYGDQLKQTLSAEKPTEEQKKMLLAVARRRYGKLFETVRRADYVVFQAEGAMSGTDFVGGMRLLLLPYLAKVVWNKPVLSMNQTLYIGDDQFQPILKQVLSKFDLVAVREQASLQVARQLGLQHAVLIPDAAFLTRPADQRPSIDSDDDQPTFTVTGSAIIRHVDPAHYVRTIELIAQKYQLKPVLLFSTAADRGLLELAPPQWQHIDSRTDHATVASIIERSWFLIGGRYHMSILAAATRTPFVQLPSNTFKNEGLAQLLDYPLGVRKFDDREGILEDIEHTLRHRANYVECLDRAMQKFEGMFSTGERFLTRLVTGLGNRGETVEYLIESYPQFHQLTPSLTDDQPCSPEWDEYYRDINRLFSERATGLANPATDAAASSKSTRFPRAA